MITKNFIYGQYTKKYRIMSYLTFLKKTTSAEENRWIVKRNSKGEYKMQERYLYVAQNSFPIIGQLRRQFPKEKKYKDRLVSSWTSWMLPVSLRMMTARELNVGKIGREREERELRQLKKSLERQE